jgi:serine/threonine protein kinase
VCFGALTNCHSIIFICAVKTLVEVDFFEESETVSEPFVFNHFRTAVITENVARELAMFGSAPKEALGLEEAFPIHVFSPNKHLGRGSTGDVVSCSTSFANDNQFNGLSVAVKISNSAPQLEREASVLRHLFAAANERSLDVSFLPPLLEHSQLFATALNEYPIYRRHVNVFGGVYSSLLPNDWTIGRLKEAWSILQVVHSLGIVHCDVRQPNFMLNKDGKLMLVDWSAARTYAEYPSPVDLSGNPSCGSIVTASTAVLKQMARNPHDNNYSVCPKDEACSLLLMAAMIGFPESCSWGDEFNPAKQYAGRQTLKKMVPSFPLFAAFDALKYVDANNQYDIARIVMETLDKFASKGNFPLPRSL